MKPLRLALRFLSISGDDLAEHVPIIRRLRERIPKDRPGREARSHEGFAPELARVQ